MIIGKGDIAKVLEPIDREDRLFFASGVSNSREDRTAEFSREKDLLFEQYDKCTFAINKGEKQEPKLLVYFGSLSIFYSDTSYARHKRKMEQYVKMFPRWAIVRIGNIDWGTNPNTIINSMRNQLARKEELEIRDEFRYVVNQEEFLYWVKMIPEFNVEMNVPGERMTIQQIVDKYVRSET